MGAVALDRAVPGKLGLQAGTRVLLVNAGELAEPFVRVAPGVAVVAIDAPEAVPAGSADAIVVFCPDRAALDKFGPAVVAAYRAGGRLWVAYPKGGTRAGTDLGRDVDWGPLAAAGLRAVSAISIDARWSALRFRHLDEVGR